MNVKHALIYKENREYPSQLFSSFYLHCIIAILNDLMKVHMELWDKNILLILFIIMRLNRKTITFLIKIQLTEAIVKLKLAIFLKIKFWFTIKERRWKSGHIMWRIKNLLDGHNVIAQKRNQICVVHRPNCKKLNQKVKMKELKLKTAVMKVKYL